MLWPLVPGNRINFQSSLKVSWRVTSPGKRLCLAFCILFLLPGVSSEGFRALSGHVGDHSLGYTGGSYSVVL